MKRLLGVEAQGVSHPLRAAQILVRGIGLHAVEGDPGEFRAFRTSMDQFSDSLGEAVTEAAALVTVSDTLRSLERHNRSAESYLHAGGNDLRAMVKMLTAAIGEFSSAGEESVKNLRQIESSIASASQSQDVRAIRSHLATCLMEIRKETERQRAATRNRRRSAARKSWRARERKASIRRRGCRRAPRRWNGSTRRASRKLRRSPLA